MDFLISKNKTMVGITKKWIWLFLLAACALEIALFPQEENIVGCLELVYGWFLISCFVFTIEHLKKCLLPTIAIFGYGFCYCFLPLVITLIEGKPLTFNFQLPYLTFFNQAIDITVIVLAYSIVTYFYRDGNFLSRFWKFIGYTEAPRDYEVWILGGIGLLAMLMQLSVQGSGIEKEATGNFTNIIRDSLASFVLAPLCLLFKRIYSGKDYTGSRRNIILYISIIIIIGIATTRRYIIFNGVLTIALMYLTIKYLENEKIFTARNALLLMVGIYLITGPLADLAAAMILNRQFSFSANAGTTFKSVMNLFNDKEKLHNMYQLYMAVSDNNGDNSYGWSEYYVDNIFMDRFCNLRVCDATLYNAKEAGFDNDSGKEYYKNFWITEVPSPIAKSFGLKKVLQGTVTDEMVITNFGSDRYSIFGYKVGGQTGIGLYMFGYAYYIIAFLTYLVIFFVMSSFVGHRKNGMLIIPVPILVVFMRYWTFFLNANGIFSQMGYTFTRQNLNKILIYCILMFVLRLFRKRA
jgi:hypothetical protein